eukprot:g2338.t1
MQLASNNQKRSSKRKPVEDGSGSGSQGKRHTAGVLAGAKNSNTSETDIRYEDGGFPDVIVEDEVVNSGGNGSEFAVPQKMPANEAGNTATRVYRPGRDTMEEDETLDFDPTAYKLYHSMTTQWPCLTFDVIRDRLGVGRKRFPVTLYMAAGTQADKPENNEIILMKLSDLHKVQRDYGEDDEEEDEDDSNDLDEDPILVSKSIKHIGGINRLRSMPQSPNIISTWSDTGTVYIYDAEVQIKSLDGPALPGSKPPSQTPIFSFEGHGQEGYAMDWSKAHPGRLITGDCDRNIHLFEPLGNANAPSWSVNGSTPFLGHTASVEDLQWSPTEKTVFASCSMDRSVRIWDTRQRDKCQLSVLEAHEKDVNVISWNSLVGFLLASGGDDGAFKVWDLRNFKRDTPVAHFKYHLAPITSVEWSPTEDSVIAVSGADDQVSIWDMSLEEDREEQGMIQSGKIEGIDDLPPQLLFVHQGQRDIKEIHFHPQVPGVILSTAGDGFNVFRSCNM